MARGVGRGGVRNLLLRLLSENAAGAHLLQNGAWRAFALRGERDRVLFWRDAATKKLRQPG